MERTIRRQLNTDQLAVLQTLYTFRFATSEQLAQYFQRKNKTHIKKRLRILEEQGYIAKRYDSTYRLRGRPAAYCLTPKGARILQEKTQTLDERVTTSLYRNKRVSEASIDHYRSVLAVYLHLRSSLPDNFLFLTGLSLSRYVYLPTWLPDGFLGLPGSVYFFLDVLDHTKPSFTSIRKVRNYLNYAGSSEWPITQAPFPCLLMVCDTLKDEKRLQRQIQKALGDSSQTATFVTTTMDNFTGSGTSTGVWHDIQGHEVTPFDVV